MNKRMIKVGISCDDPNIKQISKTFSETQIFELCIPIFYDYSTALSYHHKIKKSNHIRTTNIHHANESIKNSLNIIDISDKAIPIKVRETAIKKKNIVAEKFFHRGLSDLKAGEIDVFVVSQTSINSIQQITSELSDEKKSLPILTNEYFRIANIFYSTSVNIDMITEKIEILHSALLYDFMVTFPRIAILSDSSSAEIITTATQIAFQKGIFCFGFFDIDFFLNSNTYKKFDAALIVNYTPTNFTLQSIQPTNNETNAILISNIPYVVTITNANNTLLTPSIYLAIDVYRNRKINQKMHNNSSQKFTSYNSPPLTQDLNLIRNVNN